VSWSDRRVGLGLILGIVLAACAETGQAPSDAGPPASKAPVAATPTALPTAADVTAGRLVIDASLLAILPRSVAGFPLQPADQTAAGMITNVDLQRSASALTVGYVIAAGNSRSDDLAVATVIQLRPGVFSDTFYSDWRTSYDRAACASAGGVSSHIQQYNGQHQVEVTVCGQGARTLHTHLAGDILVSITAVGDRKFGDLVMNGLRR
jgi:hypothetical protein